MINLMPPQIKEDIRFAQRNVLLFQYAILAILVSAGLVATIFFGLTLMSSDETAIKESIVEKEATLAALKPQEDQANALASQITTISSLLNKELDYSQIIVQIGGLIPEGATLLNLDLRSTIKTEPLSLTVNIDTQSKAAVVQQNFEKSPLFAGADIQSITPADRDANGNIVNYNVTLLAIYTGETEEDAQ